MDTCGCIGSGLPAPRTFAEGRGCSRPSAAQCRSAAGATLHGCFEVCRPACSLPPGPSNSSHHKPAHVPESLCTGSSELTRPTCICRHQPPQLTNVPQSHSILHAWSPEKGSWLQVAPAPGLLDLCLGKRGAVGAICRGQPQHTMESACLGQAVELGSKWLLLQTCSDSASIRGFFCSKGLLLPETHLDDNTSTAGCAG